MAQTLLSTKDKLHIVWDKKYELGIPVIDEQHKKLVALCGDFYDRIVSNPDERRGWKANLEIALKECVAYVQSHFHDEEILLRAAGYKDFDAHKKQHDTFTRKVLETAQGFDSSNTLVAIKFAKFLYEWILSHVLYTDKQYVPSILEYYKKRQG